MGNSQSPKHHKNKTTIEQDNVSSSDSVILTSFQKTISDPRWIKHDRPMTNPNRLSLHYLFWQAKVGRCLARHRTSKGYKSPSLSFVKQISPDTFDLAKMLYRDKMAYCVLQTPEQYRNYASSSFEYATNTIPLEELGNDKNNRIYLIHRAPYEYTLIDEVFARDLQKWKEKQEEPKRNMMAAWTLPETQVNLESNPHSSTITNPENASQLHEEEQVVKTLTSPSAPEIEEEYQQEGVNEEGAANK
jgi:hypothetical protein